MSRSSVWAFTMESQREAIVDTHTDWMRILNIVRGMKQSVSKVNEY